MRMPKLLLVTRGGRRVAGLSGSGISALLETADPRHAADALAAPGRSWLGVAWHRPAADSRLLREAMRLRKDLPFVALESAGTRGARAARRGLRAARGLLRGRVALPVTGVTLVDILVREAHLMESETRLAAARARARTYQRRLSILADIAQAANSVLEPRRVMEIVMSRAQDLIPTQAWTLFLIDEKEHMVKLELAAGDDLRPVKNYRFKIGQGVAGWVVQYKKPVLIDDVREDRRFDARFDMLTGFRTRSILSAPLISRGRIIGAVEMMNRRRGRFGDDDLAMLTTLVEPGAIALENAILYQRSTELTVTDDLTKLFNSRYLNVQLGREIKRSKRYGVPVSLIFLDLDGFKQINDNYGHLAGSRALYEVGQVLQDTVREIDVVSRYGGDEFTVILPQTGASGAMIIADRIRKSIADTVFLTEMSHQVKLTASFGVATFPDCGETREDLIQQADQAMYRVKGSGKNGVMMAVSERQEAGKGQG